MSMTTTDDVLPDPDVIDLEPTLTMELAGSWGRERLRLDEPGAVALAEGTLASLAGETETCAGAACWRRRCSWPRLSDC